MYLIVYVSSAVNKLSNSELVQLLETCRRNNAELNVTGMLLYKDGNFIQAVEGEKAIVKNIMQKVIKDNRHKDFTIIFEDEISERDFPDWSMGFYNLGLESAENLQGYSNYIDFSPTEDDLRSDKSIAIYLLNIFKKTVR